MKALILESLKQRILKKNKPMNMEQDCSNMTYLSVHEECLWYYSHKELFWVLISIAILLALVGVVGNALVIYAATKKNPFRGVFHYLNHVVISLAVTDFCLLLFGTPCDIVYWYWGKNLTLLTWQLYFLCGVLKCTS